jgi:hypothetical protein
VHREVEISDSDGDISDLDLPESVTQAQKCHVIIDMRNDVKPPTESMNGTEVICQATFEDLHWEPKVLVTEAEKQAEWKKNAEWTEAEAEPDQMTQAEKAEVKRRRQTKLTPERQRRCQVLIKEQNPKPKKHRKNINEVHQKIQYSHAMF